MDSTSPCPSAEKSSVGVGLELNALQCLSRIQSHEEVFNWCRQGLKLESVIDKSLIVGNRHHPNYIRRVPMSRTPMVETLKLLPISDGVLMFRVGERDFVGRYLSSENVFVTSGMPKKYLESEVLSWKPLVFQYRRKENVRLKRKSAKVVAVDSSIPRLGYISADGKRRSVEGRKKRRERAAARNALRKRTEGSVGEESGMHT